MKIAVTGENGTAKGGGLMSASVTYNLDCMEYLQTLPNKEFDLAIVDPPYGIGEAGDKNASRTKLAKAKDYKAYFGHDDKPPPPEYFAELLRVSKNQIIFGANFFLDNIPLPHNASCWLVWDKQNGDNDFADCEMAWTSFKSATRLYSFRWAGMLQGDMKNKETRIHPNQKPVALYQWIFSKYAKKGDKILDTHLGSGSSRIAAYEQGLYFVGIEADPDYFAAEENRFADYISQMSLFRP